MIDFVKEFNIVRYNDKILIIKDKGYMKAVHHTRMQLLKTYKHINCSRKNFK